MSISHYITSELVHREHLALFKQKAENRIEIIHQHLVRSATSILLLSDYEDIDQFRQYSVGTSIVIIWSSADKQHQVSRFSAGPKVTDAIAAFLRCKKPHILEGGLCCYINPAIGRLIRRMLITIPPVASHRGLFPSFDWIPDARINACKQWLKSLEYEWIFVLNLVEDRVINRGNIGGLYSYSAGDTQLREMELIAIKYEGPIIDKIVIEFERTNEFREDLFAFCKDLAVKRHTGTIFIIGVKPIYDSD